MTTLASTPFVTESEITCPHCGHSQREVMPLDACLYFYECAGCGALLRPHIGDCCVFCSYGTDRCPPMQQQAMQGGCGCVADEGEAGTDADAPTM